MAFDWLLSISTRLSLSGQVCGIGRLDHKATSTIIYHCLLIIPWVHKHAIGRDLEIFHKPRCQMGLRKCAQLGFHLEAFILYGLSLLMLYNNIYTL